MLTIRFLKASLGASETELAGQLELRRDKLAAKMRNDVPGDGARLAASHPLVVKQIAREAQRGGYA